MIRKILLFFMLVSTIFAGGIIEKIEDDFIFVRLDNNENDIKNGAFVIKNLGDNSSIIARAKYIEFDGDLAKFELYTFSDLKQKALPIPALLPSEGDEIIFNNLIQNTILIAPSKNVYEKIILNYPDFNYFNTDVLAASLYKDSKVLPTRNDFRDFCKNWALGSVMYASKDKIILFECSSLNAIYELDSIENNEKYEKINFHSNISKELSKKTDYFSYYSDLFKLTE